ncbi:MAG TPA: hypothetical protein VND23_05175 [Acidimicrobiales bacterium]|nr:hypothetical protein [Acidimicrobiales bacterium]
MPGAAPSRVVRRARTAATLPGRLIAVEERCAAIESHVVVRLDEMRAELAALRALVEAVLETETDVATLVGRLLASMGDRVDAVEEELHALVDSSAEDAGRGSTGPVAGPETDGNS